MKLRKKSDTESPLYSPGGMASWAETNPSNFRTLAKQAKVSGMRPPEFWVKEDESRLIRFIDLDAIASFNRYNVRLSKKEFKQFIQPRPGKRNVFQDVLGLRPQRVFVFRVIDIEGYKGRKGRMTNLARFYVVGARVYEQIRMMAKENSDQGSLNQYNVKVSRTGSKTDTTYMFMPKPPTPLTSEMKRAIRKFPSWTDHYKPTSESAQEALLAQVGAVSDEEDED